MLILRKVEDIQLLVASIHRNLQNFNYCLAKVIDNCNSKEELFVNVRAYAKDVLTDDSYKDFNEIFKGVLQTVAK